MARLFTTFDVFDTLIARRSVDPARIFQQLERREEINGLTSIRLQADRDLGSLRRPYQLREVWQVVRQSLSLDAVTANRLMTLEIEIEHEESILIAENLALVRDGDVLVSDTYLPTEIVRSLLHQAGLRREVALVISNDGKFTGRIWTELLQHFSIQQHLGDNPHSDGRTPSAAGIPAVIYTGAARTPLEQLLVSSGWQPLADLVREARRANPFPSSQSAERHLWLLTCQLNFPLLLLASLRLEQQARASGAGEILFVSHDGRLWHELFRRLFPQRRCSYLYTSRRCLLKPSPAYLDYFRSAWRPDCLIVDLFSTGASWSRFFERLGQRGRCFFIGLVDDYTYLPGSPPPADRLDIACLFRNSQLGFPVTKSVEMLNYAPHACVEDVLLLPGGSPLPILADTLEYDRALPEAAEQAFTTCLAALRHQPDLLRCPTSDVDPLIQTLLRLICADPQLPTIYPGHQAADAAYLRHLLD